MTEPRVPTLSSDGASRSSSQRHATTAASLALSRDPSAPKAARDFAHDMAEGWVLFDTGVVSLLDLAVSELVTNAVVHGEGVIRLKLIRRSHDVIVEVYDDGPAQPAVQHGPPSDFSGRGLHIVESVAQEWGVERSRVGKVVWCSIAC